MKRKKVLTRTIKIILLVVGLFALGFLVGMICNWVEAKPPEFHFNYLAFIFALLGIFFGLIVHELGHGLRYATNGREIRYISFMFLCFYKNEKGKWRFCFKWNLVSLMIGLTIPNMPIMNNYEDFKDFQRAYKKTILWGPIACFIAGILALIGMILIRSFADMTLWLDCLYEFLDGLFLMGVIGVVSNFAIIGNLVGDFPLVKRCLSNEKYVLAEVCEGIITNYNWQETLQKSDYIKSFLIKSIKEIDVDNITDTDIRLFINAIQYEYLGEHIIDEQILKLMQEILEKDSLFNKKYKSTTNRDILYSYILFYFKQNGIKTNEEILQNYNAKKDIIFKKDNKGIKKYYNCLIEYILFDKKELYETVKKIIRPNFIYPALKKVVPSATAFDNILIEKSKK